MSRKIISAVFILFMAFLIFIPVQDSIKVDLNHTFKAPSAEHILGTDNLGRDVFALLARGCARTCVVIAVATAIAFSAGNIMGTLSGYYGGVIEQAVRLLADITLVVPSFIMALIVSAIFGMDPLSAGVVFGIGNMGEYINQSSSLTKRLKKQSFIEAEEVLGLTDFKIITKHVIPNILRPLLTFMGNKAGAVSIQYASLAFIGLGTDISNPDWGTMLYQYRLYILYDPWLIVWPTLAIFCLAFFFHYVFDDMDDKKHREVSLYD